jgi:exopolyphosphatase/pppGpp-phosphohydrolase
VRVAAIDLGTNSTRLLVADVEGDEMYEVVRRLTITRLGEGVDARRRLLPLPIARVRNCLADYRRVLEEYGANRTLAIATSSVRDAENGEAFLGEIEWSYGFSTLLLSGVARRSSSACRTEGPRSQPASTSAACALPSGFSPPTRRHRPSSQRQRDTSVRSCLDSRLSMRSVWRGR